MTTNKKYILQEKITFPFEEGEPLILSTREFNSREDLKEYINKLDRESPEFNITYKITNKISLGS